LDRIGHFGGSLLFYFGLLCIIGWRGNTFQMLMLSLFAGAIAASMSVKPDMDSKMGGIFHHRNWFTHSLATVFIVTGATYILFNDIFQAGILSNYITVAVFSAILSHILLDSFTKKGVPLLGPFDNRMFGLRRFKSNNLLLNWALLVAGLGMAVYYFILIW